MRNYMILSSTENDGCHKLAIPIVNKYI